MHFSTAIFAGIAVLSQLAAARPYAGQPPSYEHKTTKAHTTTPYKPTTTPHKPTATPPVHGGCTFAKKRAGIQHEIDTISSHSLADANQIPLAPDATRTFYISPAELGGDVVLPPVNVGFTAETMRLELVLLATALNAGVPPGTLKYINNANGTVTSDFIQTDQIVLPYVSVREVHEFNDQCQITKITGYVNGNVVCPRGVDLLDVLNPTLSSICNELFKLEGEDSGLSD